MQKAVSVRNKLPETVAKAGTIATFYKYLDRYTERKDIGGIGPGVVKGVWSILFGMDNLGQTACFHAL